MDREEDEESKTYLSYFLKDRGFKSKKMLHPCSEPPTLEKSTNADANCLEKLSRDFALAYRLGSGAYGNTFLLG